ncbi:hypothetical protein [Streptomyces cellulosae]|uniref:PLL-like beta propeller domain-containing protein n=1 Tax=Streptomyces cellulosae TaxID=1968 RepID=A0ABW7YJ60_STRCE
MGLLPGRNAIFDPAITAYEPERYTIYHVGTGQKVYRKTYTQGSDWETQWFETRPEATIWSGLAAASAKDSRIDLFGLDRTNQLRHASAPADGSWGPFNAIGGNFQGTPAAVSWGTGRLDVFARGATTNKLFHRTQYGTQWNRTWTDLGGALLSGPGAASWGPNRLDVFAKDKEHHLVHKFFDGSSWSDWTDLGLVATDDNPAAVSRKPGNIELFVRARDSKLYHRTYTADQGEIDGAGGITNPS